MPSSSADDQAVVDHSQLASNHEVLEHLLKNKLLRHGVVFGLHKEAQKTFSAAIADCMLGSTSVTESRGNEMIPSTAPSKATLPFVTSTLLLEDFLETEYQRSVGHGEPHTFMRGNGLIPTLLDDLCNRHVVPNVLLPRLVSLVEEICNDMSSEPGGIETMPTIVTTETVAFDEKDDESTSDEEGQGKNAKNTDSSPPPQRHHDTNKSSLEGTVLGKTLTSNTSFLSGTNLGSTINLISSLDSFVKMGAGNFTSSGGGGVVAEGAEDENETGTEEDPEVARSRDLVLFLMKHLLVILEESIPEWPQPLRASFAKLSQLAAKHDAQSLKVSTDGGVVQRRDSVGADDGNCSLKASMLTTIVILRVVSPTLFTAFERFQAKTIGPDQFCPAAMDSRRRLTFIVKTLQKIANGRCFDAPHEAHLASLNEGMGELTEQLHSILNKLESVSEYSSGSLPSHTTDPSSPELKRRASSLLWFKEHKMRQQSEPEILSDVDHVKRTVCSRLILACAAPIIGYMGHHQPVFIGLHEAAVHAAVNVRAFRCNVYQDLADGKGPQEGDAGETEVGKPKRQGSNSVIGGSPSSTPEKRSRFRSMLSRRGPSDAAAAAARQAQFHQLTAHGYYAAIHPHVMQFAHRFMSLVGANTSNEPIIAIHGSLLAESYNDFARSARTNRLVIKKLLPLYHSTFDDADIVAHICSRLDALLLSGFPDDHAVGTTYKVPNFSVIFFPAPESCKCPLGPQWFRNVLSAVVDERITRACQHIVAYRPVDTHKKGLLGKLFSTMTGGDRLDAKPLATASSDVPAAPVEFVSSLHEMCEKVGLPLRETNGSSVQLLSLSVPEEILWQQELAAKESQNNPDGGFMSAGAFTSGNATLKARPTSAQYGSNRELELPASMKHTDPNSNTTMGSNSDASITPNVISPHDDAMTAYSGDFHMVDTWRDIGQVMACNPQEDGGEAAPLWQVAVTGDVLRYVAYMCESPALTNRTKYSLARETFTTIRSFTEIHMPATSPETAAQLVKSYASVFGFLSLHTAEEKLLFDAELHTQLSLVRNDSPPSSTHSPRLGLLHVPLKNLWRVLLKQIAVSCRCYNCTIAVVAGAVEIVVEKQKQNGVEHAGTPNVLDVIQTVREEVGDGTAAALSLAVGSLAFAGHILRTQCFLSSADAADKKAEAEEQLIVVLERFMEPIPAQPTLENYGSMAGSPATLMKRRENASPIPSETESVPLAADTITHTPIVEHSRSASRDALGGTVNGVDSAFASTASSMITQAVYALSLQSPSIQQMIGEDGLPHDVAQVRVLAAAVLDTHDLLNLMHTVVAGNE